MKTSELQKRFDELNKLYWDGKFDCKVKAVKPRIRRVVSWDRSRRTLLIDNSYKQETVDYFILCMLCMEANGREHFLDEANRIEEVSHGKYLSNKIVFPRDE